MIEFGSGNLLDAPAEALINTVNTVGVAGKGLALQFRQAYPANFKAYAAASKRGEVVPGRMFVFDSGRMGDGRYLINFPTKRHWRGGSRLSDIEAGLADLVRVLRELEIRSVAVPPLGCGNGGLAWSDVLPLITDALAPLSDVRVIIYAPSGAPDPDEMPVRTTKPELTSSRAAVLALFDRYLQPDYRLGALEAQKLTYFLQLCGEPLRLKFTKGDFGPYAENLNHALQYLEGHYIRGYGDRTQPMKLALTPNTSGEVEHCLAGDPATAARVERAAEIIDGFETPYGLELLSTVHWAAVETSRSDLENVAAYVQAWTERKGKLFTRAHISAALAHLEERGLLGM
ncbi:macro domain-containing protein [Actinocorallia lasiicapitis]